MAYLLKSADTSAFTIDSTFDVNEFYIWTDSSNTGGVAANATGTVTKLNLFITSWATTSIKACLYENDILLNSVVIPSSVGTGLVQVAFPPTLVTAGAQRYRFGFYKIDASNIVLKCKTGSGQEGKRRLLAGSYTSPIGTFGAPVWQSWDTFYWSMEDAGGVTIGSEPSNIRTTESRTIRITVPTTAPTTVNTNIKINSAGNAAITPTSCTLVSGLTYDITFTVPDAYAGLPYSSTGYPIIVTTTDGTATSGNVPYLPVTGNDFVNPTVAVPGDIVVLSGTFGTDDQLEYGTAGGTISIDSSCVITYTGANPAGVLFSVRAWDNADDTWGSFATMNFGGSSGGGGGKLSLSIGLGIGI